MLISYEPLSDVLSIVFESVPVAQTQQQGAVAVSFDAQSRPVSISIPNASTLLWEHGGQISVMLPQTTPVVAVAPIAVAAPATPTTTVVRETTVVERPLL